ncbi:MAG: hypothetical protein OXU45_03395 [Candidatus Melainabacteria bacterium]|nr:hypothetical protein [Candidatus Melainabacteria bacterium]
MILESLNYAWHAISCPKYVKDLKLLHEIIAIEARYKRCRQAWQPHLEQCKKLIIEEAKQLPKRERIIIFGAGSLHDVPLKELSHLFEELHLVDIFFLQAAIDEMKTYPNLDFHQLDITGVLRAASQLDNDSIIKIDTLTKTRPRDFLQDENIDMVVSLNLLSQLPVQIKDYYERNEIRSTELNEFYQSLILNHLGYLRAFAASGSKTLLISDTERLIAGEIESSLLNLDDSIFNGFEPIQDWTWLIAPQGELDPNYDLSLRVKALRI